MANVDVECLTCGNEQVLVLQLDQHYTDSELAEQLGDAPECEHCYEINWSVIEVKNGGG